MKVKFFLLGTIVAASALAGSQMAAAENYYIGAQYAQATYEQSNTLGNAAADDGEADPTALIFVGGYKFNENVALEGRLGLGLGDDDFEFASGGSTKIEVSRLLSILGKFSVGGTFSPYAVVGFTDFELDADNGTTVEGDGLSYGVGVDFSVSENAAISLEYINYASPDINGGGDADLTAISIGVNYTF
jgi:outer membrane autotransporter protein